MIGAIAGPLGVVWPLIVLPVWIGVDRSVEAWPACLLLFTALLGSVLWGDTVMLLIQNAARTGPTAEQAQWRTVSCLILGTSESLVAMGFFAVARLARRVLGDREEATHGMGESHGSRTALGLGVALTVTAVLVRVGVVPFPID